MSTILSFSSTMSYIGYIIIAILILLFMVLIHELGHYTAGKLLKFKINEFSVGFGPKIFQKTKKNGEKFTLRVFPLGGYCAFEGENEDGVESKDSFNKQKPWKRLIVLFFGAFFNFLSAIIFSFILLLSNGYDLIQVKTVGEQSINYEIMQSGDVIYGIENEKIDFVHDKYMTVLIDQSVSEKYETTATELSTLKSFIKNNKVYYIEVKPLVYNVKRNGKKIDLNGQISVVYNDEGEYAGWSLLKTEVDDQSEFKIKQYKYSFGEALGQSIPFTFKWAYKILVVFGQLITGQLSIKALGGPVTTINMIATSTRANANFILVLLPYIATNLAVFNLLPIPALDGCQMIFVTIEWIRKKPLKRSVINAINNIGLLVLLGFVIIVDIMQFVL